VDFVLGKKKYAELKNSLVSGQEIKGMRIFDRPGLDLIGLSDPDLDALAYIGVKNMAENVKVEIE
jgi:hypothetical protein